MTEWMGFVALMVGAADLGYRKWGGGRYPWSRWTR